MIEQNDNIQLPLSSYSSSSSANSLPQNLPYPCTSVNLYLHSCCVTGGAVSISYCQCIDLLLVMLNLLSKTRRFFLTGYFEIIFSTTFFPLPSDLVFCRAE